MVVVVVGEGVDTAADCVLSVPCALLHTLMKWLRRVHSLPPSSSSLAKSSSAWKEVQFGEFVGHLHKPHWMRFDCSTARYPTPPPTPSIYRTHHAVQPEGAVLGGDDAGKEEGGEALALQHVAHDLGRAADEPVKGGIAWLVGIGDWMGGGGVKQLDAMRRAHPLAYPSSQTNQSIDRPQLAWRTRTHWCAPRGPGGAHT